MRKVGTHGFTTVQDFSNTNPGREPLSNTLFFNEIKSLSFVLRKTIHFKSKPLEESRPLGSWEVALETVGSRSGKYPKECAENRCRRGRAWPFGKGGPVGILSPTFSASRSDSGSKLCQPLWEPVGCRQLLPIPSMGCGDTKCVISSGPAWPLQPQFWLDD